jgi:Zn-finger in ubiquitin-hydrolases and other protein
MSARTRGKRKPAAPEDDVAAPSKPAKRARRGKQEPERQDPPEPAAPPPDVPPPPVGLPPKVLPPMDVKMDSEVPKGHESSLDREPSHLEANEEPGEDDLAENIVQEIAVPERAADLYLDTVNRTALDFDFEKVCSISLSNLNVYGCLVCGKYFQGRSKKSPAYAHSISEDHHVFINLESTQVSVLSHSLPIIDELLCCRCTFSQMVIQSPTHHWRTSPAYSHQNSLQRPFAHYRSLSSHSI